MGLGVIFWLWMVFLVACSLDWVEVPIGGLEWSVFVDIGGLHGVAGARWFGLARAGGGCMCMMFGRANTGLAL